MSIICIEIPSSVTGSVCVAFEKPFKQCGDAVRKDKIGIHFHKHESYKVQHPMISVYNMNTKICVVAVNKHLLEFSENIKG